MVAAIPRAAWQDPAKPVTGPARKATFSRGVVHYEGVNRDITPPDIANHLRQMQSSYLSARGYSLGYGYAVVSDARHPDDGSRWEIRGTDLNMASNPGRKWVAEGGTGNANNWTGSVLLIGPTGVRASSKAAASVRSIFSEWHAEAGTAPVGPFPHLKLDYTSCCGVPYLADLEAGLFDPSATTLPPPPVPDPDPTDPIPQEIADMLFIAKPTFPGATANDPWIVYYSNPGTEKRAERATNAHVNAAAILGVPLVDQDSQEQYLDARSRYGI